MSTIVLLFDFFEKIYLPSISFVCFNSTGILAPKKLVHCSKEIGRVVL